MSDDMENMIVDAIDNNEQIFSMPSQLRCIVKDGWYDAGKTGVVLFDKPVQDHVGMDWTAVLWDDEEDPDFHKTRSLKIFSSEEK
jgi:hypothetical protein